MELCNRNILILGLAKYDSEIESTIVTLAKHLARKNNVFYIETPYTWKDLLLNKHGKEKARRDKIYLSHNNHLIDTGTPNLKVMVMPTVMSINWVPEGKIYRALLKLNESFMRRRIQKVLEAEKIQQYVFINSFNFYYPDLGNMLSPEVTAYHCVDPLVYPAELKHGLISERKLVENSNVIICTSKRLYDEKKQQNQNTFFVPNAADIAHSSKALQSSLQVHSVLAGIKKPVVGYFGNIERRLDYELIDAVTAANPDTSFVFAGPVIKEHVPDWFFARSNIHLTGAVPYSEMPQVLKGFDTAIIPFKKDAVSATIFPLKLFEYLGAGKPVVATDFNPDLKDFTNDTVAYCSGAAQFSEAIKNAIDNDSAAQMEARLKIAAQNTWEKRGNEFSTLINKYMPGGAANDASEAGELQNEGQIIVNI
ncbi:MAG: glycosyltransferase [Bacteroidota bacterium]